MFMLAPLVSIATEFLGRYAARLLLVLAAVVVVLGSAQAVRALRLERDAARASATAAEADRQALAVDLAFAREEARVAGDLAAREAARVSELTPRVESLLQELHRAKTIVPKGCERVLDPLRSAVRGLRDLRASAAAYDRERAAGGAPAVR